MKVLFCIPKIMAVEPAVNWGKLPTVDSSIFIYPFEEGWEHLCLLEAVKVNPAAIFLFAFLEGPHKPKVSIKLLKVICPTIYMSTDGGCSGAWPALKEFNEASYFTKIVNIDGMPCPWADLVTLSPLEQQRYLYRGYFPLRDKTIRLGFMGGSGAIGDIRRDMNDSLAAKGILTLGTRDESWGSNEKYTDFMNNCKAVINYPYTGRGQKHVKSRCLETGLARAVLLEQKDSPLNQYCTPGKDYFEWETEEDIVKILDLPMDMRQEAADNLHRKAKELTDPEKWLSKVLGTL